MKEERRAVKSRQHESNQFHQTCSSERVRFSSYISPCLLGLGTRSRTQQQQQQSKTEGARTDQMEEEGRGAHTHTSLLFDFPFLPYLVWPLTILCAAAAAALLLGFSGRRKAKREGEQQTHRTTWRFQSSKFSFMNNYLSASMQFLVDFCHPTRCCGASRSTHSNDN